jgi:aryl-alcohol dehydrogenase-like predicted oxidoreductase
VSQVGLGCSNFGVRLDAEGTREVVDAAIDAGITYFDTADIYGNRGGSETLLGATLKGRRDQVVIATKWGHPSVDMKYGPAAGAPGGRSYIRRAIEGSLRRLETDYIDLYQFHKPDPSTPIAETLMALGELVQEGKVRYIGGSGFSGWQLVQAVHTARELGCPAFVSAGADWSLLERQTEKEIVPAAAHYGLGVVPFWPLANGLLTGKYRDISDIPANTRFIGMGAGYVTKEKLALVEELSRWASQRGRTTLEVALGYLGAQPTCGSVIAGAMSAEQVRMNSRALDWSPTIADAEEIGAVTVAG